MRLFIAMITYLLCVVILTFVNLYFYNGDSIEYIKSMVSAMMFYIIYREMGED